MTSFAQIVVIKFEDFFGVELRRTFGTCEASKMVKFFRHFKSEAHDTRATFFAFFHQFVLETHRAHVIVVFGGTYLEDI